MTMHERIMSGKLFTDMCEGLPQERSDAKKRMIAFNQTTPDDLEERFHIQKDMLHESSGNAWIEPPFYFCYGTQTYSSKSFNSSSPRSISCICWA